MKDALTSLHNIGKVLAQKLEEVGISTIEELKAAGSENAFIRLRTVDEKACINELMAIEGAIQGIRWHDLDDSSKDDLRIIYQHIKQIDTSNR